MNKLFVGFIALILMAIIAVGIMYTGGIQVGGKTFLGLEKLFSFQQDSQNGAGPYSDRRFMQGPPQNRADPRMNSAPAMPALPAVNQAPLVLRNIENLNKATKVLNEAIKMIQLEPFADSKFYNAPAYRNDSSETTSGNKGVNQTTSPQNGTVINIFPNNLSSGRIISPPSIQNMGIHYDPVKMERLHSKLYKVAYGMELLRQLNDDFAMQTEIAGANLQNPAAYYQNFYNITITNKMKLNQALADLNEAEDLVNINPYISSEGLIYDRERMGQIHSGIFKLAEGVAQLALLNSDLLKQSVSISNLYQNFVTTSASNDMGMGNSKSSGSPLVLDTRTLVNIIVIIFVIFLIVGLFGFVANLFHKRN